MKYNSDYFSIDKKIGLSITDNPIDLVCVNINVIEPHGALPRDVQFLILSF